MIGSNPGVGDAMSVFQLGGSLRRVFDSILTSRPTGSWVRKSLGRGSPVDLPNYPRVRSTREVEIIPPGRGRW